MDRDGRFITARIKIRRLFKNIEAAHLPAVTAVLADETIDDDVVAAKVAGEAAHGFRHGGLLPVSPLHWIKCGASSLQSDFPDTRFRCASRCGFRRLRVRFFRQRLREVSRSSQKAIDGGAGQSSLGDGLDDRRRSVDRIPSGKDSPSAVWPDYPDPRGLPRSSHPRDGPTRHPPTGRSP